MRKSARRAARLGGAAAVLSVLAMTVAAGAARAAVEQQPPNPVFTTWATDVNVRMSADSSQGARCAEWPSPGNCPKVNGKSQPGDRLEVTCQTRGETVGSNPNWVFVENRTRGFHGFMAGYFISHPDNWLPGVPQCYGP